MALPINTNIDFFDFRVPANELVEDWAPVKNPWVKIFGTKGSTSYSVQYPIAIDLKEDASTITDKDINGTYKDSERNDFTHVEWKITKWFIKKNHVDLLSAQLNHLSPTGSVEMALSVTNRNKLSKSTLAHYHEIMLKYTKILETKDDSALEILISILNAYDELYQDDKIFDGTKIYTKNTIYDKLVYLNNNQGVVGDNTITQSLRFSGGKLYIKDIEIIIFQDRVFPTGIDIYITDGSDGAEATEAVEGILLNKAFIFYYLITGQFNFNIYDDGKKEMPYYLVARSEIYGELIPYLSPKEKKDENGKTRWAKAIKVMKGETPSQKK